MKQLIITNPMVNINDFRRDLIRDYNLRKKKVIESSDGKFKILNSKPVFDGQYFGPNDCFIIHSDSVYTPSDDVMTLLFHKGYMIDEIPLMRKIIDGKYLLSYYLNKFGLPLIDLYLNSKSDYPHNFKYDWNGSINEIVDKENEKTNYGSFPWDNNIINAYTFFYYMYKPVSIAKVNFSNYRRFNFKLLTPFTKHGRLLIPERPFGEGVTIEDSSKEEKNILNNLADINHGLKSKVDLIPRKLNSTACEIMVGVKDDGEQVIINVKQTHTPLCEEMIGHDKFVDLTKDIFYDIIGD